MQHGLVQNACQKRYDIVQVLIKAVKEYDESETFQAISEARLKAGDAVNFLQEPYISVNINSYVKSIDVHYLLTCFAHQILSTFTLPIFIAFSSIFKRLLYAAS